MILIGKREAVREDGATVHLPDPSRRRTVKLGADGPELLRGVFEAANDLRRETRLEPHVLLITQAEWVEIRKSRAFAAMVRYVEGGDLPVADMHPHLVTRLTGILTIVATARETEHVISPKGGTA